MSFLNCFKDKITYDILFKKNKIQNLINIQKRSLNLHKSKLRYLSLFQFILFASLGLAKTKKSDKNKREFFKLLAKDKKGEKETEKSSFE